MVILGTYQNLVIKTKPVDTVRKEDTSNLNVISCKIRIRKLLQIRRENN